MIPITMSLKHCSRKKASLNFLLLRSTSEHALRGKRGEQEITSLYAGLMQSSVGGIKKDNIPGNSETEFFNSVKNNDHDRSSLAYSLSLSDAASNHKTLPLTELMKQQLSNVRSLKSVDNNSEVKGLHAGLMSLQSRVGDVTNDNITRNSGTDFFNIVKNNNYDRSNLAYSLSFSNASSNQNSLPLTELMKQQLSNVRSLKNADNNSEIKSLQAGSRGGDVTKDNIIRNSKTDFFNIIKNNNYDRSSFAYSLSFSNASSNQNSLPLTELMKQQLSNVRSLRINNTLPRTLNEALSHSTEACVITSAVFPFPIVHVNSAWEGLCGYSKDECVGKTMAILQGPDTDKGKVTTVMNRLLHGEKAECDVLNYAKDGKTFLNSLSLGPVRDSDGGDITHFIGVLKGLRRQNI